MKKRFDYQKKEKEIRAKWQSQKIYQPDLDSAKNPYYVLYMFPYPSAEGLHVGHAFSGTGADVYSRFMRMKGYDVFHPMGFDAFGIHSENYALKINDHPKNLIDRATKHFREQFESLGFSYDWTHSVNTSSPDYYKWTQWLFIQLFKAGLAEKKKALVNWCPSCKTVLADEQVVTIANSKKPALPAGRQIANRQTDVGGKVCERCGTPVEMRELEQWFFKITKYADKLLEGLDRIDWTEKVKIAQKNWIGKSEGLLFTAPVKDTKLHIDTFSAHFQAFYADTFVVIAPDHPRLPELLEGISNRKEIEDFCAMLLEKRKNEKPGEEKEPEGIFTGRHIEDPVGNGDLPIWVANFAIKEYGTGIVKCSAHDARDFAFAKKYGLRLKPVLFPPDPKEKVKVQRLEYCYTDMENGILSEPSEFSGRRSGDVRTEIIKYAEKKGFAKPVNHYHLRDWLISRQRYWGAPIPMVYCATDGWQSVPEKDLPVLLPYIENFKPLGTGIAPLAQDKKFVKTKCPKCGGSAKRETDVADTFLDSSWYFLRYLATESDKIPFPSKAFVSENSDNSEIRTKSDSLTIGNSGSSEYSESSGMVKRIKFLPVHMYIGGAEHSVLHLLYSRFVTKVLFDQKLLDFDEPFTKFRAHGLLIKDGAKMSKSRGNVINPDEYINKYGADTLRCYLMFLGPYEAGGDFRDSGIEGMERFLKRVRKLVESNSASPIRDPQGKKNQSSKASAKFSANLKIEKSVNRAIKGVGDDVENLRYNTALAKIMELTNDLSASNRVKRDSGDSLNQEHLKILVLLLAPFAPYLSEELWEVLRTSKIHTDRKTDSHRSAKISNENQRESFAWSIHAQPWPRYNEDSLKEDQITVAVQINGKLRGTIKIMNHESGSKEIAEQKAKADQNVSKYLKDKQVRKVIYVPGKILNFVID